mgnify:CR=1 FL=1
MSNPIIAKVYHNRCVLLDADYLAQAGIRKNDKVSVRVDGDAIVIRKAHVVDSSLTSDEVNHILSKFGLPNHQ